jgi:hypothetical protein
MANLYPTVALVPKARAVLKPTALSVHAGEVERVRAGLTTLDSRISDDEKRQIEALVKLHQMQRQDSGERKALADVRDIASFVEYRMRYDLGAPMTFNLRPWQRAIYNSEFAIRRADKFGQRYPRRRTLLVTARQCEKSTNLGNKALALTALISNFTFLYVTTADLNLMEFIDERVENVIRISPHMAEYIGKFLSFSRYLKRFGRNNSKIVARSANLHADRTRGIAADGLGLDEFQNMQLSIIPVITATLNNSPLEHGPIQIWAGTPLSLDNPTAIYWRNESTQNKWMTRCDRCTEWNPPGWEQVGPKGMICSKCGNGLNPLLGRWVRHGNPDASFEGFHLSRVLMPYTVSNKPAQFETRWRDLYRDINSPTAEEASIRNEILGEPFDSGRKAIKEDELRVHCHPGLLISEELPPEVVGHPGWPVYAGIDWGEGGGGYTVIALGFFNGNKFQVSYLHRYVGRENDPTFIKRDIIRLLLKNRVNFGIGDAGMGFGLNDDVQERLDDAHGPGAGRRMFHTMRYSGNVGEIISVEEERMCYTVHRTRWMARVFSLIKKGRWILPRWQDFGGPREHSTGFAADFTSIFRELSAGGKQIIFNHTDPDDAFHACLYCYTAGLLHQGDMSEFHAANV